MVTHLVMRMAKYTYYYNGVTYTVKELAEISGIAPATLRDRLRRGYSVEEAVKPISTKDSVINFAEASWWEDWIDMPISDLHTIYWKWCVSHGYTPLHVKGFSRQLFNMYPNLKSIPAKRDGKSLRVIRVRSH